MKNIKILLYLLLLIGVSSCDDFLSETPDNRLQIDTPEKISELLADAYPDGTYMEIAETMSDNVSDNKTSLVNLNNVQNYNWDLQDDQTGRDTQGFYWNACYKAIATTNHALEAIKKLGNAPNLNPQKGEALLARAYAHFMLVSLWSNRYNPATAATDLGIPYVTETETVLIGNYKRNSMKEVFDLLQSDIEEGLKHVTNDYRTDYLKYHFNKEAAKAFAARFYTVKGDWNRVLELTEGLGNAPVGKLRDWAAYNAYDFPSKPIEYAKNTQPTNLLVGFPSSIWGRGIRNNRFFFTRAKERDEILGSQTNIFNKDWLIDIVIQGASGANVAIYKFDEYFKYTNVTAQIGLPYTGVVLFSNDEMFLNRIEAHVMTNQLDIANAELEYFLAIRTDGYAASDVLTKEKVYAKYPVVADEYTPFYALTPEQTSYIKAITEARRREFLHEGLRWFDIKRFNLVVEHNTFNQQGQIIKNNILVKDDKRRAVQIPLNASNNGIEKNPR
ncbi:RagB/SusD family nutrient uptake outer membrane protein [Flavobacterium piscis]|uniref:RagB/SusD family nutrient uptake outer membrane protein n=1 Tax=Flavobacterium piscis TaxID=1114874 RepID=A0ABU1Y8D3_9FLAO|nr:RagB/SusD family nutrient uptake outer membrane protein [Flavobacterium piscis]MDR7210348.1 hypothetical protein [Flavobacterium piscis]